MTIDSAQHDQIEQSKKHIVKEASEKHLTGPRFQLSKPVVPNSSPFNSTHFVVAPDKLT